MDVGYVMNTVDIAPPDDSCIQNCLLTINDSRVIHRKNDISLRITPDSNSHNARNVIRNSKNVDIKIRPINVLTPDTIFFHPV